MAVFSGISRPLAGAKEKSAPKNKRQTAQVMQSAVNQKSQDFREIARGAEAMEFPT
jgi:hypothetical protein